MPSTSIILSLAAALPAVLASPYGAYPAGNYSQPINYSNPPAYQSSVSVPVYDVPKSTPCTSSTVKKASSTPVYNDYGSYPASTPKNDYPSYPASTPKNDYPSYPMTSSKPSYGDNYKTPSSKTTITTTYTTTYVDICETGYITKTTTFAVTYCPPTATPTPGGPKKTPTNYGWDYETKVCNKGCGEGPKTVTVTVPCKNCNYAKPTPPAQSKPVCNGYDCVYTTTKVYSTKVVTITKTPVPQPPMSTPIQSKPNTPISKPSVPSSKPNTPIVYTPVSSPASKPVVPASSPVVSKPTVPTGPPGKTNNTMSIGTGVKPTPSKTGYVPPAQFTGAAAGVQAGGFVAVVAVAAAMFL
ncbi:hypothetical protein DE146DRAFT_669988 [Phaeosphaeria sp. MPI-PUGE-AT-0046c]|nr:hypothetical protein DE146DRAFT_669988 [Phaeosphaeria sp. MPI-PUGE-AT-0046c]